METFGFFGKSLDELLNTLAGLASRRQRDRGLVPTRWSPRWRTLISVHNALNIGRSLLEALPSDAKRALFDSCLGRRYEEVAVDASLDFG